MKIKWFDFPKSKSEWVARGIIAIITIIGLFTVVNIPQISKLAAVISSLVIFLVASFAVKFIMNNRKK